MITKSVKEKFAKLNKPLRKRKKKIPDSTDDLLEIFNRNKEVIWPHPPRIKFK